jgi:hypothetical protein
MRREICPVCNAANPAQIEYREGVPVLLNRLANTVAQAHATARAVLDIVGCSHCGFVWNRSFDPSLVPYDFEYENDQTHSGAFRAHVERMAAKVLGAAAEDELIDVVEIGCGQGRFLRALAVNAGSRLRRAVGFDPAFRSASSLTDPRIHIFREYFNEKAASRLDAPPSLVVTRHTIEHVAEPIAFLKAIRQGIGGTSARLFVETPDVSWIIAHGEIEDLFYEHCSLFDPTSMAQALRVAGFTPIEVECVFGDQYLWAEATANDSKGTAVSAPPRSAVFPNMTAERHAFATAWQRRIVNSGPVIVWGAGAKGVTFCNLVDPDGSRIAALVDINPGKQRKYLPISGHCVVSPADLPTLRPTTVIVMNPNYRAEIAAMLSDLKIQADLLVVGYEAGVGP